MSDERADYIRECMERRTEELEHALTRLLAAFEADERTTPRMPIRISWETNGGAIEEARRALLHRESFDYELDRNEAQADAQDGAL